MTIRICIADQQHRVRYGLRVLLEQQPGWAVNGEATTVHEIFDLISINCPDLLLLDWELLGSSALDMISNLRTRYPNLIIISMSAQHESQQAAIQAGVDGFISKIEPPEKLICLIHKLIRFRSEIKSKLDP